MTLHKKILFFLKKVQNEASRVEVITQPMLSSWQDELKDLLNENNTVVDVNLIQEHLSKIVNRQVTRKVLNKNFKGSNLSFTQNKLSNFAKKYLNERILFSVSLIKDNRESQVKKTLQRFNGWVSAVPTDGITKAKESPREAVRAILKPLVQRPFEERRVLIDQGHKLSASINDAIALDNNVIAVKWNSHWHELNYHYRQDHKERDKKLFFYKDNYFVQNGFIKKTDILYINDVDGFGQKPFCRCYGTYYCSLMDIPKEYLTKKGMDFVNG
ncbi:unnamed protein product [Commensalibacter communis]|uniref:hypothetical protein n=1 Tax=Commensalibacter communis TaxID=2972786 RepID=UPI0022FF60DC|nr:hypothetical protein [Commensalibacter communis]CAI3954065.1 unnamed protein product [Commensalibacter communis]CAI3958790.1 unnamed protein product [Commensalibacter communis]